MNIKISLIFAFIFLSDTSEDILITQLITSITKKKGNTAFLECKVKRDDLKKNAHIHWYRQKPGQPLRRILYISSNENVVHERGVSEDRYEARRRQGDPSASLRIHHVEEADAGLYFCACCDTRQGRAPLSLNKNPPTSSHLCKHTHLPLSLSRRDLPTVTEGFSPAHAS